MTHWTREYSDAEQKLFTIRARLARLAYHRWQFARMQELDLRLADLSGARADHEALCRLYAEARDHHRAARLKLRRHYYALLRFSMWSPSNEAGIEAKVHALGREHPESEAVKALCHQLERCLSASSAERTAAGDLHDTHRRLRQSMLEALEFVEESVERSNAADAPASEEESVH